MNILILNGSPRTNGNTATAIQAFVKGISASHDVTIIRAYDQKITGCLNCNACKKNGGRCVVPDGSAEWIDQVNHADVIVFASPVYWWGISAKAKLALDKFYSKDEAWHDPSVRKKLAVIAVGADALSGIQYRLIEDQFKSIAEFLGWDFLFSKAIQAADIQDLSKNSDMLAQLEACGKSL